jgi:hypothetical protein
MASRRSVTLTSPPSLINSGRLEAVPMDHHKKIGSVPQKNCGPALTAADPVLGTALQRIKWSLFEAKPSDGAVTDQQPIIPHS